MSDFEFKSVIAGGRREGVREFGGGGGGEMSQLTPDPRGIKNIRFIFRR